MMKVLTFAFVCGIVFHSATSYYITIDASEEQCYFERVMAGSGLTVMFEVTDGGFHDVDFKITRPDGSSVYSEERQSSGNLKFAADTDGPYTFCFGNKMSSMTPKEVIFTVDIKPPAIARPIAAQHDAGDAESQKLEQMISELNNSLKVVKREQEYMEARDRAHRFINESTNGRVVWWAIFEAGVLIGVTICQIYYLRRYFEVRTLV